MIKNPDNPIEGMTGMMMKAAAYTLVSAGPWLVPDHMGEIFSIPQ